MSGTAEPRGRGASLALELTRLCPASCLYCYNHWKGPARPGEDAPDAEPSDLGPIVDAALSGRLFTRADLTGGEPMSRPDFFEIVDRVLAHRVRPALITGGTLIGPDEASALARRQVALVQPTILSADAEVHDRLKGQPGGLKATIHAIALLRREGVEVSVAFLCTRPNQDHLEEVMRLCRALGVTRLAFSRLIAVGEAARHREELQPEAEVVAGALERLAELGRRYRLQVQSSVALPHCSAGAGGGRCSMASGQPNFTVDPWGRVRPCSVSSEVLGRLPGDDWPALRERYEVETRLRLERSLPEVCRRCEALARCGGGCRESGLAAPSGLDPLARPGSARGQERKETPR